MDKSSVSRDLDGDFASAYPDVFTNIAGTLSRVPDDLVDALRPARWIVYEWTEYTLSFPATTHLRIGSRVHDPVVTQSDGLSHFRVRFENELGLAVLQPLFGHAHSGNALYLEVIARKFEDERHSLAFLRDVLADLFARGKALPFDISTKTFRAAVDTHLEIREWLQNLNERLAQHQFHFGYRVFDEIAQFIYNADRNGMFEIWETAFDHAVFMKVRPKFNGSHARLRGPLQATLEWANDPARKISVPLASDPADEQTSIAAPRLDRVATRVQRMLDTLEANGFVSFG